MLKYRLAAASALAACTAHAHAQSLDLPSFDSVQVASGQKVYFKTGNRQSVDVEMVRGDLDDVVVKVEDGVLVVQRKSSWTMGKGALAKVTVVAPELDRVKASSGGYFKGVELDVGDLSAGASSGAAISLAGRCQSADFDASSGASLQAKGLECVTAKVDASSGATIKVFASERVNADGSSGASIAIYGGATDVDADRSSGASVMVKG
ncbi:MAG: head GIN domain-containing protein [Pseudomonadota bacterium]